MRLSLREVIMGKFMIIALGTLALVMIAIFLQLAFEHRRETKVLRGRKGKED